MKLEIDRVDVPMPLGERLKLKQISIPFCVPPHEVIFMSTLEDVISKQKLCNFVNDLLVKLDNQHPTIDSAQPNAWEIMKNNVEVNLESWNPRLLESNTALHIVSDQAKRSAVIVATGAATEDTLWSWSPRVRSIHLPDQKAYLAQSHIFVVLVCKTKSRTSNKKRIISQSRHTVFVPRTYTPAQILKLIQCPHASGIFHESEERNLRAESTTIEGLGWNHGALITAELW